MPSPQSPSSSLCCCLLPATIGHGLFAAPARDLPRNQPSIHRESPSNSTSRLRLASTISADACLTAPGCEGHASQIPIAPADKPATSRGFVHWRLSNVGRTGCNKWAQNIPRQVRLRIAHIADEEYVREDWVATDTICDCTRLACQRGSRRGRAGSFRSFPALPTVLHAVSPRARCPPCGRPVGGGSSRSPARLR